MSLLGIAYEFLNFFFFRFPSSSFDQLIIFIHCVTSRFLSVYSEGWMLRQTEAVTIANIHQVNPKKRVSALINVTVESPQKLNAER